MKKTSSKSPVTQIQDGKTEALDNVLAQIRKQHGEGSIMKMGERVRVNVEVTSTGSIGLDHALGIGGVPRGRVVEIYGPESSGKTTLALHILAEAQKNGGEVAFIDAEHALDAEYARKLGVDVDRVILSQPDNGEQALAITESLVRSGTLDIIVIDSVAALVPRSEIEGEMGDSFMGMHARLMSQALRKLTGIISKSNTTAIFINQIRERMVSFGNPETTTGGRALKFYSSVRLDVRRGEALKSGVDIMGNRTKVKVIKNKMAPPFRDAEFDIMYGEGISKCGEILDIGVDMDLVQKSGSWFAYKGAKIGQGRDNAKQFLKDNEEIADEIEALIRQALQPEIEEDAEALVKEVADNMDLSDYYEEDDIEVE